MLSVNDIKNVKNAWKMAQDSYDLFSKSMGVLEEVCRIFNKENTAELDSDDFVKVNAFLENNEKNLLCRTPEEFFTFYFENDKKNLSEEDFNEKWKILKNSF